MLREQNAPSGPRPTDFSTQNTTKENLEPASSTNRPRLPLGREPPPVTFPSRNKLQSSFGGYNTSGEPQPSTDSYDFLPSASFDDLHSSIATASNGLGLEPFPKPAREENIAGSVSMARAGIMDSGLSDIKSTSGNRGAPTTRPVRSGSLLRRTSISTRQTSISSTASAASGNMDPPTAPLAMRTRRQSQYPPISSNNTAKNTRKSIGPGVVDTEFSARTSSRRRPSLASSTSTQNIPDTLNTGRAFGSSVNSMNEGGRLLTARAAKSKSLQPPSRQTPAHLNPSVMTPEHARSSSFAGRSPGRNGRNTSTPSSSARRMSTMPSANHASGLGARTISPTDARRMKRLSTLNGVPPMPHTPPTNQLEAASVPRASSRSPSMLPRKAPTPSSSRTTPDLNRKSYGSGLSMVSNGSNTTARTSTGSLQPRLPQILASSSRLPTPKLRNVHSSAGNEDEEEVPPVPAIPKAYESPKDSPQEIAVFTSRKSSLPFDASSINSTSTNELSGNSSIRERLSIDPPSRARRNMQNGGCSDIDQKGNGVSSKKKHLQPLRLPPLNLLPLSTPTTDKIAALNEPSFSQGNVTPPPKRSNAKTPSTPMTASKASFFLSRNRRGDKDEEDPEPFRSSTSVHHRTPIDTTLSQDDTASFVPSQPMAVNSNSQRHAVSPFVSSSLPKSSGEFSFLPRSKTSGDFTTSTESIHEQRPVKLSGPRAHKLVKSPKTETAAESSPEEPNTPSSATSLRRKLSLGWRRNTSKSSINLSQVANEKDQGHPPQPPKHNDMPPPRLPASATMNSMNNVPIPSPSPSNKSTTYLDSKRRKSSTSSLSLFTTHDRTRSDSWGLNRSPKKDDTQDVEHPKQTPSRSTSSIMGPVHRMVGSKSSTASMKPADPWTIDLDKGDMVAEEEMKKLGSRRKETENAARLLDALRKRATPKERVSSQHAIQVANLNIYERGEIVDYKDIYFCGTQNAAKKIGQLQADLANFGYDDDRGDYAIVPGDHLSFRYEIIDILGKGSFGQVVRCIDHKTGGLVAIKIIRNKKRFHQQALVEVNILQKLREWDPQNKHSMVNFTQSFYFRGHLCISTELLDMNLYEFIKSNGFRGFSLKLIRRFTKQLLSSLLLLKQHKVIHCDLKPENILLAHPMHSEIKVIDFGSSCFENEKVYTYIQSRFYRSPEVILGMSYGMPIDMWSVGCILAELFTGYPIFPGENEQEQLACIMEVFGPPEKHLIEKSTRKKLFFDSLGKPRLTVSSKGRRRKPSSKTLQQVLKCEDEAFLDFLSKCLRWDPDRRLKPDEAIRHEFLTGQKATLPPPSRMMVRNESPIKRYNSVAAPSYGGARPLPEPPVSNFRNGGSRARDPSPGKVSMPRRLSNVHSLNSSLNSSTGSKRTSTGPPLASGNSGLPRVTTRSFSGKQDLASAGATAAMRPRA